MVVEQHSLCWVTGRLAEQRDGVTWAKEFRQLPNLRQATQDGGTGLAKGLALVNQERQQRHQATGRRPRTTTSTCLREGQRALRRHARQREPTARKSGESGSQSGSARSGRAGTVGARERRPRPGGVPEQAMDAWSAAEQAWAEVAEALRLFTPRGSLEHACPGGGGICRRPAPVGGPGMVQGAAVAATAAVADVPGSGAGRAGGVAAWRRSWWRRRCAWKGCGVSRRRCVGRGRRRRRCVAVLLAAGLVLSLSGEAGTQALAWVRDGACGVWRASSLVECINSVARMQQGRHRKMTQGLLDLKRLYWNCRAFRTGQAAGKTPYELQGLHLPTRDWWELLQRTPEQLRQQLQACERTCSAAASARIVRAGGCGLRKSRLADSFLYVRANPERLADAGALTERLTGRDRSDQHG